MEPAFVRCGAVGSIARGRGEANGRPVDGVHADPAIRRQIAHLVYEVYGLTDDETRIVEEATGG